MALARATATPPQRIEVSRPHKTDFHHREVPKPIEVKGRPSSRLTTSSNPAALARIIASRTATTRVLGSGAMRRTMSRITTNPNKAPKRPIQVIRAGAAADWFAVVCDASPVRGWIVGTPPPAVLARRSYSGSQAGPRIFHFPSSCMAAGVKTAPAKAMSSSSCGLFPLAPMAPTTLPSTIMVPTLSQKNRNRLTDEYPECLAESGIDRFSHKDRESCRRRRPMRSCADARGRRSCPDAYPLAR